MTFEVTNDCGLSCRYCYNFWKIPGSAAPKSFGYRECKRTLRTLLRKWRIDHIAFSGGEPLMAERLPELVLTARLASADVTIISNGSGSLEDYGILVDLGVSVFEIPFHHFDASVHDRLTRTVGSAGKARACLEFLVGRNACVIAVIVLTRENVDGVESTLRSLAGMGVRKVMLNRFNPGGEGFSNIDELTLLPDELGRAYQIANDTAVELSLRVTANVSTPWCVIDPLDYPSLHITSCADKIELMPITVTGLGDVRICNHSPVILGNVHQQNLDIILKQTSVKDFFDTIPQICTDCPRYPRCLGGCKAVSQQSGIALCDHDPVKSAFPS